MSAQFHETRMGNKFYEGDIPRLIKAVEKIGNEMELSRKEKDDKATFEMEIDEGKFSIFKAKDSKYKSVDVTFQPKRFDYEKASCPGVRIEVYDGVVHILAWRNPDEEEAETIAEIPLSDITEKDCFYSS